MSHSVGMIKAFPPLPLAIVLVTIGMPSSGCLTQPSSELEALGVIVAPYLDLDAELAALDVLDASSAASFTLKGSCGEVGGTITISNSRTGTLSTTCGSNQKWSLPIDLSSYPDGSFEFSITHSRASGARTSQPVTTPRYYKITALPTAPTPARSASAVNPSSGNTFILQWEPGVDSAGQPLMSYEYSVYPQAGGTAYQEWTSVGSETEAEISIPTAEQSGGGTFIVKIRGTDQASQTTPEQTVSVTIDTTLPTNTSSITPAGSSSYSLNQSPTFSWNPSHLADNVGVERVEYRLVVHSSNTTIIDWSSHDRTVGSKLLTGLSLSSGTTYRFEIRVVDLAGNRSSETSATWTALTLSPTLAFTSVPSSGNVNSNLSVTVSLQDGNGNVITTANQSVQLTAFTDSGCTVSASGTYSGDSVTSSSGVATFGSFQSNTAQSIYLKASSAGYSVACSSTAITLNASVLGQANFHLVADTGVSTGAGNVVTTWTSKTTSVQAGVTLTAAAGSTISFNSSSSIFNSQPAVVMSGVGVISNSALSGICSSSGFTRIIVFSNAEGGQSNKVFYDVGGASMQNYSSSLNLYTQPGNYLVASGFFTLLPNNTATLLTQVINTAAASNADKVFIRRNGTRLTTGTVGSPYSCNTSSTGINVGSIHPYHTPSGSVAEIAQFNRPLTSSELQSVESELGAKYGITIAP